MRKQLENIIDYFEHMLLTYGFVVINGKRVVGNVLNKTVLVKDLKIHLKV